MSNKKGKIPSDHYIINTVTRATEAGLGMPNTGRNWVDMNLTADPEFAELTRKQGPALREEMKREGMANHLCGVAKFLHTTNHLTPGVYQYRTDEKGWIWIPKEEKETAKRIFLNLRKIDPEVSFHEMGLRLTPAELKELGSEWEKTMEDIRNRREYYQMSKDDLESLSSAETPPESKKTK
jgi:hypothetical protein